jgi:thiamine-phosphate pyrophosphorylase
VRSRQERLERARLYLVCEERDDAFLRAALRGGVDIVQLRMKRSGDPEILAAARRFAELCREHEALFILNDRPDLAVEAGADGVHLGQDDMPVAQARQAVGAERLIGLSTHSEEQIGAAHGVDYIGVGPVHATPTKPGRAPVGVELVRYAARQATLPFFAIGGLSVDNVGAVRAAGASRIAVVRALTEAPDPELAARRLRSAIAPPSPKESLIGAA